MCRIKTVTTKKANTCLASKMGREVASLKANDIRKSTDRVIS